MSDKFWGEIYVPVALMDAEIKEAFKADTDEIAKPMEDIIDGLYSLGDSEAPYGEFPDLEKLLVRKGVPFDRHSEAKFEYSAEIRKFRPAQGDDPGVDVIIQTDSHSLAVIYADDVRGYVDREDLPGLRGYLDQESPVVQSLEDWIAEHILKDQGV